MLLKRDRLQRLGACVTYQVNKGDRSEGAFPMIYVERSGHEPHTMWRISKLKNKIWHSDHYRNIVSLKKTHKQVTVLYLQNNTLTLWNNSCSFSRDLVHGTRWTSPPFHHYWCYAVIDHNVVAAGIWALIWKKWNSYWYALNIGTPGKTMEMY